MPEINFNRRDFVGKSLAAASLAAASYNRILGANDRISVGMIGCGGRGLLREVLQFVKETNTQVTAVCDTWRQQRDKAVAMVKEAGGANPEQFVNYQDLLALRQVDAVVIGTPDHQHCIQLAAAMRAGKDAYCEKPLAMDLKELHMAVDAVKKSDRIVQMGTQVRSWPGPAAARAFILSGGLGKVLKIEQSRNSYRPYWHALGSRPVAEADVDWKGFLMQRKYRPFNARQYAGWYGFREFSRGPHTNLMVHFIDLVHAFTGAKYPRRAITMGGTFRWKDEYTNPDSVETVLEYPEEGFLARYCTVFGTNANSYMKVIGTRGILDCTAWKGEMILSGQGSQEPDRLPPGAKVPPVEVPDHMLNFLECVRNRKQPNAPIEAGYGHSIAVLLADESMVRGARMTYDPLKKTIHAG